MFPNKRLPASLAAAALALAACNSPDRVVSPAAAPENRGAAFTRDMMALKAKGLPEAEREEAIRALLARYGQAPVYVPPKIVGDAEGAAAAEPLAKSAITSAWKTVKTTTFDFPYAMEEDINVAPGGTLTATLTAAPGQDFTDPFLLAYYKSAGVYDANAFRIQVVGFDDDADGTLNSRISWTNNTGSVQRVSVIGFAYSPATGGGMELRTHFPPYPGPTGLTGSVTSFLNVSGIAKYNDEAGKFPCLGPTDTRVTLSRVSGSNTLGHTALVVDSRTLTGALVRVSNQNMNVGSVVASGYPNLFLTFVPRQDYPVDDGVTRYTARQQNAYVCDLLLP
jgi:hypothetical protein